MRSTSRYWVHVAWLLIVLSMCLVTFVAFWPYRAVEWTNAQFIVALSIPALLYAHTSLLVPADPRAVTSWRDYFFDVRVPLFSTGFLYMTVVAVSNQSTLAVPPTHPTQILNYGYLAIYAIGLASANPTVHIGLPIAFISLFAVGAALLGASPPDSIFRTVP